MITGSRPYRLLRPDDELVILASILDSRSRWLMGPSSLPSRAAHAVSFGH